MLRQQVITTEFIFKESYLLEIAAFMFKEATMKHQFQMRFLMDDYSQEFCKNILWKLITKQTLTS
jgi:hypothetical protein